MLCIHAKVSMSKMFPSKSLGMVMLPFQLKFLFENKVLVLTTMHLHLSICAVLCACVFSMQHWLYLSTGFGAPARFGKGQDASTLSRPLELRSDEYGEGMGGGQKDKNE